MAHERRTKDEAARRRRIRFDALGLEARKGEVLADLDALAEQMSSDPARLRPVRPVREWVEDAETTAELDDLDDLREAASILADDDHGELTDWWCPACPRLLENDEEVCASCGIEEIRPATTRERLSARYPPLEGVLDVPATPSPQALPGTSPAAALPSGPMPPVYVGTCGCHVHFYPAFLEAHGWSTSVTCPRHHLRVAWSFIPAQSPQKASRALPPPQPIWANASKQSERWVPPEAISTQSRSSLWQAVVASLRALAPGPPS